MEQITQTKPIELEIKALLLLQAGPGKHLFMLSSIWSSKEFKTESTSHPFSSCSQKSCVTTLYC